MFGIEPASAQSSLSKTVRDTAHLKCGNLRIVRVDRAFSSAECSAITLTWYAPWRAARVRLHTMQQQRVADKAQTRPAKLTVLS